MIDVLTILLIITCSLQRFWFREWRKGARIRRWTDANVDASIQVEPNSPSWNS